MTEVKRSRRQPARDEHGTTQGRILSSARSIFYAKGFFPSAVEEIAEQAGVSRATVYLYYRSKDEILLDLMLQDLDHQLDRYRDLAAIARPSLANLKAWLRDFRQAMDQRRTSLNLFWAGANIDPGWMEPVRDHRENIVRVLGERHPGFSLEGLKAAAADTKRARCYFMILLIEGVSVQFDQPMSVAKLPVGIDMVARTLLQFFQSGEIHVA